MTASLFADGYKPEPFWWDRTPRPAPEDAALPAKVDVLIIGSGYTGLQAAIQTARGGRDTLVIDADAIGWGCSTRNGGQISTSIKSNLAGLSAQFGADMAYEIVKEGHNALQYIGDFVETEKLECDFRRVGRFYAAHSPGSFRKIAKFAEAQPKGLETGAYVVTRAEQGAEIDSDHYHGGVVHPRHASLDPARYHQGLLDLARSAGAAVIGNCKANGIERDGAGFHVATSRGAVSARNVIVATSGYTGPVTPWQRRRIIPIGSYILATEKLDPKLVERLIPNDRVITDTRRLVVYYRTCPERRRILFGGRVSIAETDPTAAAPALHAEMVKRFPELAGTPMTHAWMGFVGYTFDEMPHLGVHEGVHYSMGYCGSGVSLASYFGRKIGLQVLGEAEGDSPLSRIPFQTRPYYWGKPWFLAPAITYYRWRDARAA